MCPAGRARRPRGADIDELQRNLREVIEMLLEDGGLNLEPEFVDVLTIQVAQAALAADGASRRG